MLQLTTTDIWSYNKVHVCVSPSVCLSADGQEFRNDLSHPVHADNCILDPRTGKCDKVQPAYTWRDYRYVICSVYNCAATSTLHCSAILYLNDGFDGGDFFFAHSTTNLKPQVSVVQYKVYNCSLLY